jgi:hypothetical protein
MSTHHITPLKYKFKCFCVSVKNQFNCRKTKLKKEIPYSCENKTCTGLASELGNSVNMACQTNFYVICHSLINIKYTLHNEGKTANDKSVSGSIAMGFLVRVSPDWTGAGDKG